MRHCPGCACRRPRLSDDLPASELIRLGAPPAQVLHSLCYESERGVAAGIVTAREVLDDKGSGVHCWAHYMDLAATSTPGSVEGMLRCVLGWAERLEGRLAR